MQNKRGGGFTLAELLIVMAIIVVLAAVAIPTFGRQLETARETGDMEIIRSAYTEALSMAVLDAADGVLDGKNGGTAFKGYADSTVAGTAEGNIKEAVSFVGTASGTTVTPTSNLGGSGAYVDYKSDNYTSIIYKVVLPYMDSKAAISQTGYNWQYVNRYISGVSVPNVVKSDFTTAGQVDTSAQNKGTWWVSFEFIMPKASYSGDTNPNVRLATDDMLSGTKHAINVNATTSTTTWS